MHSSAGVILVVDDEPAVLKFATISLESGGYQVAAASSAAQALDLVAQHRAVAFLLTDIHMPVMSGTELACQLSELIPDLPVVFMTGGRPDIPDVEILLRGGPFSDCAVIRKPFTAADLLGVADRILSNVTSPRQVCS
jgi:two-component system, cell cycle sensor histidine kinase and response regulator CckA